MDLTFDAPDRFIAGTIGQPGQRTFVIQVRQDSTLVSVIAEKQQVQVLAERLGVLLEGIGELGEVAVPLPTTKVIDSGPLDAPLEPAFRIGEIAISWDRHDHEIVIDLIDLEKEQQVGVRLDLGKTRDFITRAEQVVAAGRPPCPFCAQPVEPSGHICPRSNGYRAALFT